MKKSDLHWITEALDLAKTAATQDEVPVGAVVVCKDQTLGQGYNKREQDQNPLAHAELIAIFEAAKALQSWRLMGCSLYVTLEPCPMCLAACQQARIERVVYGAKDPKGGALSLGYALQEDQRLNHRFRAEHLPHEKCGAILSEFFRKKR